MIRLGSLAGYPFDGPRLLAGWTPSPGPAVYAIMYKDSKNANAGGGWLWAEIRPDGRVDYSITGRGGACTGCHSLNDGPRNDLVRIFERQR